MGVPAHVVEHGIGRELGQRDRDDVAGRTQESRDVDVERGRAGAVDAGERAVDADLRPPIGAVAAQEDRPRRPRLGDVERPLECRDAVVGHEAVEDDVARHPGRDLPVTGSRGRRHRRCPGVRPGVERPVAAEVESVGFRRQLAQPAGEMARVHDPFDLASSDPRRDRKLRLPPARQAVAQRNPEDACGIRPDIQGGLADPGDPDLGIGISGRVGTGYAADEPAGRVADDGEDRPGRHRREEPQDRHDRVGSDDPVDGNRESPIGVGGGRHRDAYRCRSTGRQVEGRVELELARRHRLAALDAALAQVDGFDLEARARIEVVEDRLHPLGIPAREPEAVARERIRVHVAELDPPLRPRPHLRRLELETAFVESDENELWFLGHLQPYPSSSDEASAVAAIRLGSCLVFVISYG